jgi:hypothetical protein
MPLKSLPQLGDSNWGTQLNSYISQLTDNASGGGLKTITSTSQLPTNLGADDKGSTAYHKFSQHFHEWSGTSWEVKSEGKTVDIRDFGAICDGSFNDAAATQLALAKLTNSGGTVIIPSGTTLGTINLENIRGHITLLLKGKLFLIDTLVMPDNSALIGSESISDTYPTQFQIGPTANIEMRTAGKPAIQCIGTGGMKTLKNITVIAGNGVGIFIGNSLGSDVALVYMDNVGVLIDNRTMTPNNFYCLEILSAFWIWCNNCVFITSSTVTPATVRMTNGYLPTYLCYFYNCRIAYKGFMINGPSNSSLNAQIFFEDVAYESVTSPFLTIDLNNGIQVSQIEINRCFLADGIVPSPPIKVLASSNTVGYLRNVTVRNSFSGAVVDSPVSIPGLNVDGTGRLYNYGEGWHTGYTSINYPALITGCNELTGIISNLYDGLTPTVLPADAKILPLNFDVTSWGMSDAIKTTIRSPDGTNNAAKFTKSPNTPRSQMQWSFTSFNSLGLTGGEWLIFGGWLRNDTAGGIELFINSGYNNQSSKFIGDPVNPVTDKLANSINFLGGDDRISNTERSWQRFCYAIKLDTTIVASDYFEVEVLINNGTNADIVKSFWKPYIISLPGTVPYEEVARLVSNGLQNITSESKALHLATYAKGISLNGVAGTPSWTSGVGVPNGVVTASIGSFYTRTDGGAGTTLYVKESGTGNTGWVSK